MFLNKKKQVGWQGEMSYFDSRGMKICVAIHKNQQNWAPFVARDVFRSMFIWTVTSEMNRQIITIGSHCAKRRPTDGDIVRIAWKDNFIGQFACFCHRGLNWCAGHQCCHRAAVIASSGRNLSFGVACLARQVAKVLCRNTRWLVSSRFRFHDV